MAYLVNPKGRIVEVLDESVEYLVKDNPTVTINGYKLKDKNDNPVVVKKAQHEKGYREATKEEIKKHLEATKAESEKFKEKVEDEQAEEIKKLKEELAKKQKEIDERKANPGNPKTKAAQKKAEQKKKVEEGAPAPTGSEGGELTPDN